MDNIYGNFGSIYEVVIEETGDTIYEVTSSTPPSPIEGMSTEKDIYGKDLT